MALEALRREAHGLKPAKRVRHDRGDTKTGARDVAIWLTLIAYMRDTPKEVVYFVTNNSSDFGTGDEFPSPMDKDSHGLEGRLHLLSDWDAVVKTFTVEVEVAGEAEDFLLAEQVAEAVAGEATARLRGFYGIAGWAPGLGEAWTKPDAPELADGWASPPLATLLSTKDVTGHKIGDTIWYTAQTSWLLWGLARLSDSALPTALSVRWDVKVLFSDSERTPVVIASDAPTFPDYGTDTADSAARAALASRWVSRASGNTEYANALGAMLVALVASTEKPVPPAIRDMRNRWVHHADMTGNHWAGFWRYAQEQAAADPYPPQTEFHQPGSPGEE
jgi:hypothetical protein